MSNIPLLRALQGEALSPPPVWIMRQAGRYLPEYRATRAKVGDFLSLCYTPELAAEVTLQPLRRYKFDAAIVFADILLIAQALGADLWFETGEGPRLSTIQTAADMQRLKGAQDIHARLAPIYDTLRILRQELPQDVALIGFAGAPWTVATYMIAGRGTPSQAPARALMVTDPQTFDALIALLKKATIEYLEAQIKAGAQVIKLFDSWAGALTGDDFEKYAIAPVREIITALKSRYPDIPIIAFPRGAGEKYIGFAKTTGADCVALDNAVSPSWAAQHVQRDGCVQGNLDPRHLVSGGQALVKATRDIMQQFAGGPHIFNLGHGITPEADPENMHKMLEALRNP